MTIDFPRFARTRHVAVVPLVGLALLVAACGGGQTSQPAPTTAPAKPTDAPAAKPTAAPSPSVAAVASPAASPLPSPAAAAAPGGGIRLTLAPEGNEARYRAQEQLTGRDLPSEAVGATKGVSGNIVVGPNGAITSGQSKITVDLNQITSDQSRRDNYIKGNTLEVAKFPNAEFVPREARDLTWPLPGSGQDTFELLGDLTVHGVSKPVTWAVEAQFAERQVDGIARTRVKMTDFGMTPPRVGPVLSIEDDLTLEIEFRANKE